MKRFNVTMTIELEDKQPTWKADVIEEGIKEAIEDFYWLDIGVTSIHVGVVEKALPVGDYRADLIDVVTEDGKLYANIRVTTGEYKGVCQRWRIG